MPVVAEGETELFPITTEKRLRGNLTARSGWGRRFYGKPTLQGSSRIRLSRLLPIASISIGRYSPGWPQDAVPQRLSFDNAFPRPFFASGATLAVGEKMVCFAIPYFVSASSWQGSF